MTMDLFDQLMHDAFNWLANDEGVMLGLKEAAEESRWPGDYLKQLVDDTLFTDDTNICGLGREWLSTVVSYIDWNELARTLLDSN